MTRELIKLFAFCLQIGVTFGKGQLLNGAKFDKTKSCGIFDGHKSTIANL